MGAGVDVSKWPSARPTRRVGDNPRRLSCQALASRDRSGRKITMKIADSDSSMFCFWANLVSFT